MHTPDQHTRLVSKLSIYASLFGMAAALAPGAIAPAQSIKVIGKAGQLLSGCPVEMAAQQRSASTLREVPGAFSGSMPSIRQGVTLTLKGRTPLVITGAEVVAHGIAATPRGVLLSGEREADVSRAFHLSNTTEGGFTSDVWMTGVSALRWIEVKSITYSDGSEWHESNAAKCGITPDPFVLVSSR